MPRLSVVLSRFFLITFGVGIGLLGIEGALRLIKLRAHGTEFGSLDDVRRSILQGTEANASTSGESIDDIASGNLRAIVNPHPSDRIIFDLKPNLDTIFQRVPVRTNSCGMRGPERPIAKPPDTYRIALLGDSFAFGWGVAQESIFAQRLEDNLNRIAGGKRRFEVLNFAVPGYSTFQEVARFLEQGLDFQPNAVLVFFVQNDFGFPFYVRDVYRPGSMLAATEFARLTWQAIDPKIEEQRLELSGYDPNSALKELAIESKKHGIDLYFTMNPRSDWEKDFKRLPIVKKRRDIKFINMRPDFERMMEIRKIPERDLTLPQDPHPSALRHAMYGDILTPYFMENIP